MSDAPVSAFLTRFLVELVDDASNDGRGSWRVAEPLAYYSQHLACTIVVPEGFITDFASLPRAPLVFLRFGDRAHRASVVHDLLYTTHQCSREDADKVLLEAMLVTGVPADIAQEMYDGVRIFGGAHWDQPGQPQTRAVLALLAPQNPPVPQPLEPAP